MGRGGSPAEVALIPAVLDLSAEEVLKLSSLKGAFAAIGFEIDPVGDRAVAVRAYPAILDCEDPSNAVREILDQLPEVGGTEQRADALLTILVSMACRTAVRGHVRLRQEETAALVARLSPFKDGATCPHGRPLYYRLPDRRPAEAVQAVPLTSLRKLFSLDTRYSIKWRTRDGPRRLCG